MPMMTAVVRKIIDKWCKECGAARFHYQDNRAIYGSRESDGVRLFCDGCKSWLADCCDADGVTEREVERLIGSLSAWPDASTQGWTQRRCTAWKTGMWRP